MKSINTLAIWKILVGNVVSLCKRVRSFDVSFGEIIESVGEKCFGEFIGRYSECLEKVVKDFTSSACGDFRRYQCCIECIIQCFQETIKYIIDYAERSLDRLYHCTESLGKFCKALIDNSSNVSAQYCKTVFTRKTTFVSLPFLLLVSGYIYFVTLFNLLDSDFIRIFGLGNLFDIADYTSISTFKFWAIFLYPFIILATSVIIAFAAVYSVFALLRLILIAAILISFLISGLLNIACSVIVFILAIVFFVVAVIGIVMRLILTVACILNYIAIAILHSYVLLISFTIRTIVRHLCETLRLICKAFTRRIRGDLTKQGRGRTNGNLSAIVVKHTIVSIVNSACFLIFIGRALILFGIFGVFSILLFVVLALAFPFIITISFCVTCMCYMVDGRACDAVKYLRKGKSSEVQNGKVSNARTLRDKKCSLEQCNEQRGSKGLNGQNNNPAWANILLALMHFVGLYVIWQWFFEGVFLRPETYAAFFGPSGLQLANHKAYNLVYVAFIILIPVALVMLHSLVENSLRKESHPPHSKKSLKKKSMLYRVMLGTLVFFSVVYPLFNAQEDAQGIDPTIFDDEGTCAKDPKPKQACSPKPSIEFIREGNKHLSCHRFVIASSRYVFMYSRESEPKISAVPVSGVLNFSWETSEKNKGAAAHKAERCGQEPPAIPGTCFDCLPISTLDNGPEKGMESYTHLCRQDSACLSGNNQVRIVSTEKPKQEEEVLPVCCPTEDMCKTELSCISDHSIEIKDPVLNMYFVPDKDEVDRPCPECVPDDPPPNGPNGPSGKGAPALKMHFEFGKDQVSRGCVKELRKIQGSVWKMAQDSGNKSPIKIRFEGRADSRGAADYNLKLSERRVDNAIKSFLCQTGEKNGNNQCAKEHEGFFPCPIGNGQVGGKIDRCFSIERVIHGESISGHDFHAKEEHRSVTITIPGMKEAKEISCENSPANKDQSHRD